MTSRTGFGLILKPNIRFFQPGLVEVLIHNCYVIIKSLAAANGLRKRDEMQ